ncbi:MAG: glycosyltransferase [Bacteroidales bacterium]|nr:glycosyltransferase [Bacteroidales bacterium]
MKLWDRYPDQNIIPFQTQVEHYWQKAISKAKRLMGLFGLKSKSIQTDPDYSVQDYDQTITNYSTKRILKNAPFTPDAIIVLFMQNFLSYKNLHELNQLTKAPVFLYMMDMAPMTGGCHYAWDCKGYTGMCGKCPALYSKVENDQSRKNWEFKKYYVDKTDLTIIAGTEYQFRQLEKSSLFAQKRKAKILLGINPELFKPGSQSEARKLFDLPLKTKIIFFGAVSAGNKRKGFNELVKALNLLKTNNPDLELHLAIAGNANEQLTNNLPYSYTLIGYLNHEKLAKAFQAADLFLCPSIEDSGPMMINQSIMTGTPVVAFEMGVALDLVITVETGYRAKLKDTDDMVEGIRQILELNENEYITMKSKCRNLGLRLCSPNAQSVNFNNIIMSI